MKKIFIGAAVIAILAAIVTIAFLKQCEDDWCLLLESRRAEMADSFERCAALGFPVMESYPRQCRAGEKTFVEIVPVANNKIRILSPLPGALITSPFTVKGEARGTWYFEASFPLRIIDANGKEIKVLPVQAKGEWMTTEFVPFEERIEFSVPLTATGTLVFEKDNPSGLPEYADSVSVPVRFYDSH